MDKYREYAKELVSQMTLDQKISQMLHSSPAIDRLGISAYNWWNEALHGVARAGTATVFPQAIALAATFDEGLVGEIAAAVSTEARAKFNAGQRFGDSDIYKGLTLWAPNVNIFRDPRWGRGHETYGEDPYLTSRMGCAYVRGLQNRQEDGSIKTAACAKHFAVHSGPEALRHGFNAEVSPQDLAETYLPAFKALVKEAKVESVMGAYNALNGKPCCGNEDLLTHILREEWGFDGYVVSDCWAVRDFHENHKATGNMAESASLAVNSGCDLNCGSAFAYLTQAVEEGLVEESAIDRAVTNLLTTRARLGIIGDFTSGYDNIPYEITDSEHMRELNLKATKSSLVLLKNNGILPLNKEKLTAIGVIGPNADSRAALSGNYCGTSSRYITVLEGLWEYLGDSVRILYSQGCDLYKDRVEQLAEPDDRISEVKAICEASDVVITVLGLDSTLEGEQGDTGNSYASGDKPSLNLPGLQENLLRTVCESGKPVIAIIISGSALSIGYADENADAIIQSFYPGAMGGKAIAQLLFGEYSPSGKLPVTFPRTEEELPDFTDYSMTGRTYRYSEHEALYPFGYGLSYTSFDIIEVKASSEVLGEDGVEINITLKNTGAMDGECVIEAYVKFCGEGEHIPGYQLKDFTKAFAGAGETVSAQIKLLPNAFALADSEGVFKVNKGNYTVYIGESQPDKRSAALMGKAPIEMSFTF
ncbi:MAG: glycoside hydrolase family 3 C-terminal domain-containing protein [Oscillospiraceae bacterium]|nr:glycoside hydrolase family 3 C-terminal domain-containing protein [Oscillospiraceae bacterium]